MELDSHPHSFIMVGREALFLCHMTSLWMSGHTYQIVLRATVPYDVMRAYLAAVSAPLTAGDAERLHAPRTCFLTNIEDPFPLASLPLGRRTFMGTLQRGFPKRLPQGWPWSEEPPLLGRAFPVTVERVVYFRHFDYGFQYPQAQTYVLFGERDEAHLYHYQTRELDYDQITSLARAPAWLREERLRLGVHVSVPALCGCHVPCDDPFAARADWRVQYQGTGPEREITVGKTHWYHTAVTNSPGAPPCSGPSAPSRSAPPPAAAHAGGHH